MRCRLCAFYDPATGDRSEDASGSCHRHPPRLVVTDDGDRESYFPPVSADDWCGDGVALRDP